MATADTIVFDAPPSPVEVLRAGLTTLLKRAPATPVLPRVRLLRIGVAVDGQAVDDYRTLCGFVPEQGVPPSYPHLLAFPLHLALMMRRDFPYPMVGLVHVANRIVQHAAIAPGDRLDVAARCGAFHTHPRGQVFTILAAAQRNGATVWESESSYLRIGARSGSGRPLAVLSGDVAATEAIATEAIPRAVARRYARLSGDRNPIHMSWLGARLFGFRQPIAHGMWTKARALALVLPRAQSEAVAIDVAFRAPILLPGRATFCADVRADATDFAVRDASGTRLHLIGRLGRGHQPWETDRA
ncbi:MaoC family dehydratase [Sphingomonas kyeonggiensis]|uniref:Acyl dehydratase n=1 Tax=Sphingomonas kyeonggiensis TaxID=1268553 RepID=A0A7W6JR88_9SPHN|nr:MaoC/PaaZ C-terminal domain-containing protein [Sphingomonas kyeonggiensis]MBB4098099.1 acyl dehydratase [Sphingomonas kyeonggiensis]